MPRILFMDDRASRCRWAVATFVRDNLLTAASASEAIGLMEVGCQFDVVYLDHDIDESGSFQNSSDSTSGMEVVRWVERHKPDVGRFIVHTMNDRAGPEMTERLRKAGYEAEWRTFHALYYDHERKGK